MRGRRGACAVCGLIAPAQWLIRPSARRPRAHTRLYFHRTIDSFDLNKVSTCFDPFWCLGYLSYVYKFRVIHTKSCFTVVKCDPLNFSQFTYFFLSICPISLLYPYWANWKNTTSLLGRLKKSMSKLQTEKRKPFFYLLKINTFKDLSRVRWASYFISCASFLSFAFRLVNVRIVP